MQIDGAALLLRVSMGLMFLAHAIILKIITYTPKGTEAFFESIGYPGFFAYIVMLAETGGGLALMVGYKVRLVSLALVPIMVGATLQHIPNGWMFGFPAAATSFRCSGQSCSSRRRCSGTGPSRRRPSSTAPEDRRCRP
jgi:putative oxidoreductase